MNTIEINNYLTKELLDYEDDIQKITSSNSHLTIHFHPKLDITIILYYLLKYNSFPIQLSSNHTLQITLPLTSTKEILDKFVNTVGYVLIWMANKK